MSMVVVVMGSEKLFVVFEGDLELAGGSVMKGYSAVDMDGEDGEEMGMSDL